MKKYIILIFLTITTVYSQDIEPTQIHFNFQNSSLYYMSGDSGYFQLNQTLRGWQWGGTKQVTTAMRMNQCHFSDQNNVYTGIADSVFVVRGTSQIWTTGSGKKASNGMAMQYEPTLRLDDSNPERLVKRRGDASRQVFGL